MQHLKLNGLSYSTPLAILLEKPEGEGRSSPSLLVLLCNSLVTGGSQDLITLRQHLTLTK